jgi:hypothetical protein
MQWHQILLQRRMGKSSWLESQNANVNSISAKCSHWARCQYWPGRIGVVVDRTRSHGLSSSEASTLTRRAALAKIILIGVMPKEGRVHEDYFSSLLDDTSARTPNLRTVTGKSASASVPRRVRARLLAPWRAQVQCLLYRRAKSVSRSRWPSLYRL